MAQPFSDAFFNSISCYANLEQSSSLQQENTLNTSFIIEPLGQTKEVAEAHAANGNPVLCVCVRVYVHAGVFR